MKTIAIYGGSGHGKVVSDIAIDNGYEKIIFIDDGQSSQFMNFDNYKNEFDFPIALGIGNNIVRKKLYNKILKAGLNVATLIHSAAVVSESAFIGEGSVIMPHVVINANASIGVGVIINSASVIEHDCRISNFSHISPSVALAGNVTIGEETHVGIGSCVIEGMSIGAKVLIGAGSVVVSNIEDNCKAYGNPCKVINKVSV